MTHLVDVNHSTDGLKTGDRILAIVTGFTAELRPQAPPPRISLDTDFIEELGLDSLAHFELISRIEREFGVALPESSLVEVETPRDLLRAVQRAAHLAPEGVVPEAAALPDRVEGTPASATTLGGVLAWHVQTNPDRPHVYLLDERGDHTVVTYASLMHGAARIARGLQQQGVMPGHAIAIMLPTSAEYLFSFFAVLLAGAIPVPIYPPARMSQIEDHLRRHARILDNAQAAVLITVEQALPLARLLRAQVPSLRSLITPTELSRDDAPPASVAVKGQDIAFLQYTSGSTGSPKGVILTHANLLANIRAMGQAIQAHSEDVFVSWLPLYHDMGLIGAWLGSLYYAVPLFLMSPLSFLSRPARWLRTIHEHRATLSAAPNFAFELAVRKIDERDLSALDLSSLRCLFNGAEQVMPDTLRRFRARFAPLGLREGAVAPVYGLAESAVGLAFPPLGRPHIIDRVQRDAFTREGLALPAAAEEANALEFVACGRPLQGHQIRVVDDTGHEAGEREEGRIEFRGPSATSGYYRNPEQTRSLFHGDWLDSGDRGYMSGGDLYVTGRAKDIIIRAGRNIYPHELEEAVGEIPGIRKGCVAVFSTGVAEAGTEQLVVVAETRETDAQVHARLRAAINVEVSDILGTPPEVVVVAPPHSVPKTSSGKIRRAATRELYERGLIGRGRQPGWRQIAHVVARGIVPELRRAGRSAASLLYAAYAWLLFLIITPLVWLLVAATPKPAWALKIVHHAARFALRLSRTPLYVQGLENLPDGPCVIVANHASYLDGLVLAAVIPGKYRFVAKRDFTRQIIAGTFLRRLGAEFVERVDTLRGVEDARRVADAARASRVIFFPEGTFSRQPGLAQFHMGGFFAAAEAQVPVVPVAIRGTRSMLRADQWFPRRSAITVSFGERITPAGADWTSAVQLRDAARTEMLLRLGEPDLATAVAASADWR